MSAKTVPACLAAWRYPGPPKRYDDRELNRFFDRENARIRNDKLTYEAWNRLPYHKRRLIANPETEYWRRRLDNEARAGARRTHRHRRAAQVAAGEGADAAAFIREVRSAPLVVCTYCERAVPGSRAHIDHVIPLSRGGLHIRLNLAAACEPCNRQKGALTGAEFRAKREAESASKSTQQVHKNKNGAHPVYAVRPHAEVSV